MRIRSILGIAIVSIAALLSPPQVFSQQAGGGDVNQQLQLFNSLSSDQQQQLLQRFGGQGGGLGGGGGGLGGFGSGLGGGGLSGGSGLGGGLSGLGGSGLSGLSFGLPFLSGGPQTSSESLLLQQYQLQLLRRAQEDQNDGPMGALKPGDTVLVELNVRTGNESQVSSNSNQALALQGLAGQSNSNLSSNSSNSSVTGLAPGLLNNYDQSKGLEQKRAIEDLQSDERAKLNDLVTQIRDRNPYQLDNSGMLLLPGVPAIPLAGLNDELATQRLSAEPEFEKLNIRLTRLPLRKSGEAALKPYGYDLFDNSLAALLPMVNQPVPADYIVGPGDVFKVQVYGGVQNNVLTLRVNQDGAIDFPQFGPIQVAGHRYSDIQDDISNRVSRQLVGLHAAVSMVESRTIDVFVTGSIRFPGNYTLSAFSTVTTALFAAGGVRSMGSLRSIQLRHRGQAPRTFDLYDLLMRGDSSSDDRLQAGDVIFIPPVGSTVSVDGEVKRPAIYELKSNESIADLIKMAGGLTPAADRTEAALVRIDEQQRRVVLNVDTSVAASTGIALRNGDLLQVSKLRPQLDQGITLKGYVYRPRYVAWHEGLRLSEVIPSIDDLKTGADQHYLLIRRELPPNRRIAVLSADLAAALHSPGSAADIKLMPRDSVTVFDLQSSREYIIRPLLDELKLQSNIGAPTEIIHVDGQVKVPGDYPLEPGMHVSDLIRAGGGLSPSAYGTHAELTRYTVESGDQRTTRVLSIDLVAIRDGESTADLTLQPFDRLSVKTTTGWNEQAQITLLGEVRFPGIYSIKPGETLHSVINRAGGLTQFAFLEGSLFTRRELKIREQEQLDRLAERLRTEIAEVALMGVRAQQGSAGSAISIGDTLLHELTDAKAVGRLVINLKALLATSIDSGEDVILRDGDQLIVPKKRQEVMVLGEVKDPTSHLYKRGFARDDYIDQCGGPTRQADTRRIYVVRADGSVDSGGRGWFHSGDGVEIHAGDAIVVPLDTERLPALTLYQAVSTILYNIAIAAAEAHATL